MASLTGQTIADTYKRLLTIDSENFEADASAKYIKDGDAGTSSVLSLSTNRVGIGNTAPTALLTAGAITTLCTDGSTAVTPEGVNVHITEASKYAMGIKNADASGDGLIIQAGDASDDYALRVEDYDSANDLLVVRGDGKVGIGTAVIPHGGVGYAKIAIDGANASSEGPHIQFTTASDDYPIMQIIPYQHDDMAFMFDSYYDGTYKSSDAGSSYRLMKYGDKFQIQYDVANVGSAITWNPGIVLTAAGGVGIGTATPGTVLDILDGTGTGGCILTLGTKETAVDADDVLGRINFRAPLETGTDALAVAASIVAVAQASFNASVNSTALHFQTGTSEVATTKMVIDEDGKVGIGTAVIPHGGTGYAKLAIEGANASSAGPHVQFTTASDDYPIMQIIPYQHDDMAFMFDAYYDGAYKSSDAGSNYRLMKYGDKFQIQYDSGIAAGSAITWNSGIVLDAAGRVGIGVAAPGQLLHVGDITADQNTWIRIACDTDNDCGIILDEEGTVMWYVFNDGDNANKLFITDESGDGAIMTQNETSAWDWTSDINLKTDISVIPDALSKINQIRGVNYKWKKYKPGASNIHPIEDAETGLTEDGKDGWTDEHWEELRNIRDINRIGVIAQEVNEVMPEAVNTDTDGEWTVKRGLLIPLLIEAVKELSAKVTALENA